MSFHEDGGNNLYGEGVRICWPSISGRIQCVLEIREISLDNKHNLSKQSGMKVKNLSIAIMLLSLVGCASYTIQPISAIPDSEWGHQDSGYIFYQPDLYFIVSYTAATDKAGATLTVTPQFLPNYKKPYRVTTFNFLAKSDFTFNFENGWKLTSIADKADNSTIANTLAGELKTILSAAGFAALNVKTTQPSLMYHAEFDEKGVFTKFAPVPFSP